MADQQPEVDVDSVIERLLEGMIFFLYYTTISSKTVIYTFLCRRNDILQKII